MHAYDNGTNVVLLYVLCLVDGSCYYNHGQKYTETSRLPIQ